MKKACLPIAPRNKPRHTPTSKPVDHVEIITGMRRRRRYTGKENVWLVEQTIRPSMTAAAVAELHGVKPSLLFRWRCRMTQVSVVKSF